MSPVEPSAPGGRLQARNQAFAAHLKELVAAYKADPNVANLFLEMPVPFHFHYRDVLKEYFSEIPYLVKGTDFEMFIDPQQRKGYTLKDGRKPVTFISMFRFLEFYRQQIDLLESSVQKIKTRYRDVTGAPLLRQVLIEVLGRKAWTQDDFDHKQERFQEMARYRARQTILENYLKQILTNSEPVLVEWKALNQNLYAKAVNIINDSWRDETTPDKAPRFDLKKRLAPKKMEELLAPHYRRAMLLTIRLKNSVQVTSFVVKKLSLQ